MKRLILLLGLLLPCVAAQAQVSITANSPTYNWGVLPGSVRHINVFITNGTTNLVNWSIASTTGGATATLSSGSFPWVDVTIGATGGTCSWVGTRPNLTGFTSTATVTVQAQSQDDPTKTAAFLFNVCTPAVSVIVVPFYRTLYSGQSADLQSYIQGNTNLGVTWAITSQPSGGDGALSDTSNRDTVFSATVSGRYTVTATSAADGTKTASTTIYVTGNTMPYAVTPNNTEPVDCSVDPALTGVTYDVGPSRTYTTINSVPWSSLAPGSTVRIHNDDTTGTNPTTYYEYWQISTQGTATQPVRVCGVPDSYGNLPVIDAANATSSSMTSTLDTGAPVGGITIWNSANKFSTYPAYGEPMYVIVEGLKIENFKPPYQGYLPGSSTLVTYDYAATSIRSQSAMNQVFVGNDIYNNGDGTFSDFNANNAWGGANMYVLWEGNWIHGNSNAGRETEHQLYIQAMYQVVQFNRIDGISPNAGSNLKSRGQGDIVRYNYLGDGSAREIDMVEDQDSSEYLTFEQYLANIGTVYSTDAYTPNLLASMEEVWHQHFVYGNVFQNTSADWIQHFSGDNGIPAGESFRMGTLWFYDNTINTTYGLFDTDANGGGTPAEYSRIVAQNNIVWTPSVGYGSCWNNIELFNGGFTTNQVATWFDNVTTPIAGAACNTQTTPWSDAAPTVTAYPDPVPLDNHMTGISPANFIAASSQPFNSSTFMPVSGDTEEGTALTASMATMPVRFNYLPALSYPEPRITPVTSSEGGMIGGIDDLIILTVKPASLSTTNEQSLQVTVTVAATPTPTGTVKLTSGTYSSGATTLSSGIVTITIPAGSLPLGTDTLTATYTPDSNSSSLYSTTTGTVSVVITKAIPAALTSPTPSSVLAGPGVTFTWSAGTGATDYGFRLGTTVGGNDLYGTGPITATSATPANLPTNGGTIYARLTTYYGSIQVYTDYVFTAATQSALTSPTPSTVLPGANVTFTWSAVTGATDYGFRLGTTVGGNNIYGSGPITASSTTISNLPTNGETIYAQLTTYYGAIQVYTDYTFTAATLSALTSPTPSTVLAGPQVTFSWTAVAKAVYYQLRLGTTVGANNLFGSGATTATSATAFGLPTNGETIYARLYTNFTSGQQAYTDYVFTATTQSALTSPTPSSVLPGPNATFTWSAVTGATDYGFRLGTTVGGNNIYGTGPITATSFAINNLPTNGETIYAQLTTFYGAIQVYTDYTFTAATLSALTSPTPSTVLAGPQVTFSWTAVANAVNYQLRLGTTVGANNLFGSGATAATSATASALPTNGETIYARLYTNFTSGQQAYTDYVFTAATQSALTSPTPSSVLAGPSVTFTWSTAAGATDYGFRLGTTVGGNNIYGTGPITATSFTINNLPTNGETIYARLTTYYGAIQVYTDYVFTAAP
ncbi:MAG TPA: Ig-like domain-containing protein [Terracidiphilus sp.]|nr:Ig-like domain-containing protein [Terracidiphilus sp.]